MVRLMSTGFWMIILRRISPKFTGSNLSISWLPGKLKENLIIVHFSEAFSMFPMHQSLNLSKKRKKS
ncbi:Hypothetical predicted protein [Paramuricea clavata]|uniref:Uncharacterized protein n=1 Tax=Paramuricea clavata TaxID=317549 RepID=A0A6S7JEB6_PARCT|nr:Hypothetical predicted protein [Paramuricea clavata]